MQTKMTMNSKLMKFSAIVCMAIALVLTTSCGTKTVSGDTPLEVETPSAQFLGDFKVLSWNVQDGMWADQYDNYNHFVAYVNEINPDVFCIQEAASHFDEDSGTLSHSKRYLPHNRQKNDKNQNPDGWIALAERWGHPYVVMGYYLDNYPVVITSKYPIELVKRLGDYDGVDVSHGAIHVKIHFTENYYVNFVNLHLNPHDVNNRFAEVAYYLSYTINSEKYYTEKNWLMMGDFNNSVQSPLCQEIRKNSYIDLWAEMNNYTYDSRIDFIYGTDAMRKALKACYMPMDFARQEHILTSVNGVTLNGGSGLWKYSDHYPVVAEFSLYEE